MLDTLTTERHRARGGGDFSKILLAAAAFFVSLSLQAQDITLNIENAPVGKVLETISKEYGYSFSINTDAVDVTETVTVKAENSDIGSVLEQIFRNLPVSYKIDGKIISVTEKNENVRKAPEDDKSVISGNVTDQDHFPLAGVAVMVKGMTAGTSTFSPSTTLYVLAWP